MDEDGTPTQRLWAPVADLQSQHVQAFSDLRDALSRGDIARAQAARERIREIEKESVEVHAAARKHALARFQGRDSDLQRPVSA